MFGLRPLLRPCPQVLKCIGIKQKSTFAFFILFCRHNAINDFFSATFVTKSTSVLTKTGFFWAFQRKLLFSGFWWFFRVDLVDFGLRHLATLTAYTTYVVLLNWVKSVKASILSQLKPCPLFVSYCLLYRDRNVTHCKPGLIKWRIIFQNIDIKEEEIQLLMILILGCI